MKRKIRFLIVLLFLVNLTFAQRFPVKIVPRIKAPSPVNFYNYADETSLNSPITLQLFLNDLTVSNRQIRLKVYFEGGNINFTSRSFIAGAENLFLEGGIPLTLKNTELAPYYKLQNLQGISNTVYGQSIAEGSYKFCFEIYDFISGAKLSAKECRTVFIFKNEPPILNVPLSGANIKPSDFENIVFQWTPRHINVSNVEYDFSLVEIWDDAVNPQTAFLSQTPIYEETTRATTLIYGADKPLLLPEKRYAWRVKAKALQGLEEIGLFKNQGFSEVFWFSRTAPCMVPENISAEPKGLSKINIFWDQDPTIHSEYVIAYREADKEYAKWFTKRTNSSWVTIWNLKPGTKYEYKIKGKCTYQFGEYSKIKEITTDIVTNDEANYNCGIVPDHIAISNREPHPNLRVGDEVTAGDFLVVLTNITSQSNGRISGVGYVAIPYLNFAKFSVYYENVLINTDNQLAEGEIITLYDPEFGENASMTVDVNVDFNEIVGGDSKDKGETVEVGFIITNVEIDANGAIVVTGVDSEGKPDEAIIPGNEDVSIRSANGDVWEVGEDGKITKKEGAEGGAVAESTTNGLDADGDIDAITAKGVKVYFEDSGYYSFDALPNGNYADLKKEYKILSSNNGTYNVPYKAISDTNGKDFVHARVEITDTDIIKDSIVFKTKAGSKVPVLGWNGNTAKLSLERNFDYVDEEILAVIRSKKDTTKFDVAGNLITTHLASQELKPINITIVPVFKSLGDSQLKDKLDALKKEVVDIYKKAGVQLNIQFKSNVLPEDINGWTKGDRITVGDSDVLSNYTASEKIFNNYIKQQSTYIKNTYYVFLTDIPTTKADVKGFMPLKRQFGFVFDTNIKNDKEQAKTLAHELGHGIFGLKHPWKAYKTPKGATNFLMDYGAGTVLNHMDWKKIHASGIQLYLFQNDEEGESSNNTFNETILTNLKAIEKETGEKQFVITHCQRCEKLDKLNNVTDLKKVVIDVSGSKVTTRFQFIQQGNSVCTVFYFSEGNITAEELSENFQIQNLTIGKDKELLFYSVNEKIDCTDELTEKLEYGVCVFNDSPPNKQTEYAVHLFEKIFKCILPPVNLTKELNSLLKQMPEGRNFDIEFLHRGKVYNLKNGVAQEVQNALSDEEVLKGAWKQGEEIRCRVFKNRTGVYQFSSIGIRSNVTIANGKQADLKFLSENMTNKASQWFSNNDVRDIHSTPQQKGIMLDSADFPDGEKVNIDENATFFKIVWEGSGLLKSFLKTAHIESKTYKTSDKDNSIVRLPPVATGTTEAATKVVTDITGTVAMVYDLVLDKKVREQTVKAFSTMKDQIVENPKLFFPMVKEIVLEEVFGGDSKKLKKILDEKADTGERTHIVCKASVQGTVAILAAGKFAAQLPKMAKKLAKKMKEAKLKARGATLKEITEEILDKFRKRLSDLPDKGKQFLKDFEHITDPKFLKDLLTKKKMIEAYKTLSHFPNIRRKIGNLAKVSDALEELGPTQLAEKLKNMLKSKSTSKQNLIDGLENKDASELKKYLDEFGDVDDFASYIDDFKFGSRSVTDGRVHIDVEITPEIQAVLDKRNSLRKELDELKLKEGIESKTYKSKKNEVGRQSEEMGELVTDNLIRKELGDLEDVTVSLNKAGTGDFDRIYKDGDRFIIVEAKGGASTLGSKKIDGRSVQQGNKKYFEAIIENFRKGGHLKLADELKEALEFKQIDYYKVKQSFKSDGSLKPTEISKFDI